MNDLVQRFGQLREQLFAVGSAHPWFLFAAIVILPGFGFPVSALLVLAGACWGTSWTSCAMALLAILFNMIWTHRLAAGPARSLIITWLGHRWHHWENLPRADLVKVACMLRVTPGIPLFVQNYTLGLLGVPMGTYLLISVPLNGLFVVGFVLTGGAFFEGRAGLVIAGLGVLVATLLLFRLIRSRMAGKAAALFDKAESVSSSLGSTKP